MIFKTRAIIGISRNNIVAVKVRLSDKKIVNAYEYEWNFGNLEEFLLKAKNDLKISKVRILVADNLAYTLNLKLPVNIANEDERDAIFGKINEEIPENLDNSEWDFKELGIIKTKEEEYKKVFVFTIVKDFLVKLRKAVETTGLKVEAIEPQVYAQKRHENPLIGLALKKDISGKDEKVLNLKIREDFSEQGFLTSRKKIILLIFILALVLTGLILLFRKKGDNTFLREVTVSTSIKSEKKDFRVNLLNGSLEENTNLVKVILEKNGFADIKVSDAEVFEYETTVVKVKKDVPAEIVEEIEEVLNGYQTIFPSSFLDDNYDFDVEIIIGMGLTKEGSL